MFEISRLAKYPLLIERLLEHTQRKSVYLGLIDDLQRSLMLYLDFCNICMAWRCNGLRLCIRLQPICCRVRTLGKLFIQTLVSVTKQYNLEVAKG